MTAKIQQLTPELTLERINEIPVLTLNHPVGSARIALQGAQLLNWQPKGVEQDIFWLSEIESFTQGVAIRGGVPICYPWFGGVKQPSHGTARLRLWQLSDYDLQANKVRLEFSLFSEYGVIAPEKEVEDGLHQVNSFVEKPKPEDAPSDLAIIGRYLLTPEIFEELENTAPGKGNEIQLTDAIDSLNKRQHVYAHEFKGKRFDIGSKIGFLTTNIEYGLTHPQTADALKQYIKDLAATLD